jgi:hypothetical protein
LLKHRSCSPNINQRDTDNTLSIAGVTLIFSQTLRVVRSVIVSAATFATASTPPPTATSAAFVVIGIVARRIIRSATTADYVLHLFTFQSIEYDDICVFVGHFWPP